MQWLYWFPVVLLSSLLNTHIANGRDWILRMTDDGQTFEGDAIYWDQESFFMLGRDGQLWEFDVARAGEATMIKKPFTIYSQGELRAALLREYGPAYDVSGTGHYLVVHPLGQRDQWADRFEDLYREMVHYFSSRGIHVNEPRFPLIAVVFPNEAEFSRHAKDDGMNLGGVLGYYSWLSNRVLLYDQSGGRSGDDWRETAATVVHEAAHQTAFNTGIHGRWSNPPSWICEGLGTLFEARGVNNASRYPQLADRVNRRHLDAFRRYFPQGLPPGTITNIVASEAPFRSNPLPAYAAAWATTFLFAEREPAKLAAYLQLTANKPGFLREATSGERVRDFQQVFGADPNMLETRINRFVAELP